MREQFPKPSIPLQGWPWEETVPIQYDPSVNWPKISIVTPSYNQGRYIEQTIRSVLLENYPNLEYIIIDGGSSDETVEIIKKYEHFISYWISEPDKGQSDAINKGLAKCSGEIFNWINSDDWYMPDALFEVASAFLNDPSLEFFSGFENHVGIDGQIRVHKGTFLAATLEETIEFCEVTQPSTFFKLSSVRGVGGINTDLHYIMDGEMWAKLLLLKGQSNFRKKEKVLVNFRLHPDSKTVNNALDNFLFERCGIVTGLQRYVQVPEKIISYYIKKIYRCHQVYPVHCRWCINPEIITERSLKLYFIRKYIIKQAIEKNKQNLWWGIRLLIVNRAFDLFFLKTFGKALFIKSTAERH